MLTVRMEQCLLHRHQRILRTLHHPKIFRSRMCLSTSRYRTSLATIHQVIFSTLSVASAGRHMEVLMGSGNTSDNNMALNLKLITPLYKQSRQRRLPWHTLGRWISRKNHFCYSLTGMKSFLVIIFISIISLLNLSLQTSYLLHQVRHCVTEHHLLTTN